MIKLNDIYFYEPHQLSEMKMILPVDSSKVSSEFGKQRTGYKHHGVDIPVPSGTPIKSPLDGVIVAKGIKDTGYQDNSCGGTIRIQHSDNITSRYCHVRKITKLEDGTPVKQGEVIGYTGGGLNDPYKGSSKGAHLHWELKKDGNLVNPMDYVNKDIKVEPVDSEENLDKEKPEHEDILGKMVTKSLGGMTKVSENIKRIKQLL